MDFNLDLDALRHELWEARREVNEIKRRGPDKLRLKETLTKWQWSRREDVEQDDASCIKFETLEGTIDLGADSKAVIWSVAKRSWLQHLWRREKRAGDANSRAKLEEHAPLFGIFRNIWAAGHQSLRRAITGATLEHHAIDAVRRKKQLDEMQICCECGALARRQHWLWECQHTGGANTASPTTNLESKTGFVFARHPLVTPSDDPLSTAQGERILVQATREAASHYEQVLVCTDGSVKEKRQQRKRSTWAVAVRVTPDHVCTVSGNVGGIGRRFGLRGRG